jgi:cytochrome c-type biogenesis protein CcmH/NrfG
MSEARDRDTRRQLEEERDFLLQSLDDLEVEHDSGGIDDESYAELHDDYTARAAAVIRTLRDGVDARPEPPRSERTTRRRVVVVAGIVVFALVVGVLLSSALGVRLPGQTSSGNTGASPSTTNASQRALATKITDLEAKVNATPDDYLLRIQLARAYEENSDLSNALKQSDAAITVDPNRPEGHANAARLLYLASEQVPAQAAQQQLISQALAGFDQAIKVGPDYADSYYFRGILYAFALKDYSRSQVDLQNYLIKAPTGQWATQARQLLAQVTTALESPSTTVPPTTTQPKKK